MEICIVIVIIICFCGSVLLINKYRTSTNILSGSILFILSLYFCYALLFYYPDANFLLFTYGAVYVDPSFFLVELLTFQLIFQHIKGRMPNLLATWLFSIPVIVYITGHIVLFNVIGFDDTQNILRAKYLLDMSGCTDNQLALTNEVVDTDLFHLTHIWTDHFSDWLNFFYAFLNLSSAIYLFYFTYTHTKHEAYLHRRHLCCVILALTVFECLNYNFTSERLRSTPLLTTLTYIIVAYLLISFIMLELHYGKLYAAGAFRSLYLQPAKPSTNGKKKAIPTITSRRMNETIVIPRSAAPVATAITQSPTAAECDNESAAKDCNPDVNMALVKKLHQAFEQDQVYRDPELTLIKLSERLCYNRSGLSRVINQHYNQNYNTLVQHYRITEAKRILSERPNEKIEAIAFECGYSNLTTFFRQFKEMEGETPLQWKKKK